MNALNHLKTLKNKYLGLRHGQSLANCQSLIVSKPENGVDHYGLSEMGKEQVRQTIHKAVSDEVLDCSFRIISSDFKRARESAEIAQALLQTPSAIKLDSRLRERDFGDYELKSNAFYELTWEKDAIDPSHTHHQVESAESVMLRASTLVKQLEKDYQNESFL